MAEGLEGGMIETFETPEVQAEAAAGAVVEALSAAIATVAVPFVVVMTCT